MRGVSCESEKSSIGVAISKKFDDTQTVVNHLYCKFCKPAAELNRNYIGTETRTIRFIKTGFSSLLTSHFSFPNF